MVSPIAQPHSQEGVNIIPENVSPMITASPPKIMEELKQQIETAEHDYETAVQNREQRYEMLKKRIRFLYEEGNITYLDILLRARNIGDVVNQTEYFSQLYQYDQEMITQYEEIRVQVLEKKARLEGKQSEMMAYEDDRA